MDLLMKPLTASLKLRFSSVSNISTNELDEQLSSGGRVLVLDVRPEEEYKISHIDGSVRINPGEDDLTFLDLTQFDSVVCYCSLGYRSSKMAEQVSSFAKSKNLDSLPVHNLEGSLFKWANENRPMVDEQSQPTTFVHPFNSVWSKFLQSDKRKWP